MPIWGHFLEALAFFDATAGFALIDIRATVSGRCKGVARDMYLGKDPLRQKHPEGGACEMVGRIDAQHGFYGGVHHWPTSFLRARGLSLEGFSPSKANLSGDISW